MTPKIFHFQIPAQFASAPTQIVIVLQYNLSRSTSSLLMAGAQPLLNPNSVDAVAKRAAGKRSWEMTEVLILRKATTIAQEYRREHARVQLPKKEL